MTIYIQNLSRELDEERLRKLFSKHGTVEKVNILKDKTTGLPVGIAFVEMPDKDEAAKAIKDLNGKEFGGMALNLKEGIAPEEGIGGQGQGGKWNPRAAGGDKKVPGQKGGGHRGEGGAHGGAVRRGGQRGV